MEECEGKPVGMMISGYCIFKAVSFITELDRHAVVWHHPSTYH